jgi:hypothetical protein
MRVFARLIEHPSRRGGKSTQHWISRLGAGQKKSSIPKIIAQGVANG